MIGRVSTDQPTPPPDPWGIHLTWIDAHHVRRQLSAETVDLLRSVVGTPPDDLAARAPIVTRPGRDPGLGPVVVDCEDGSVRRVESRLPDDFPLGYHRVRTAEGTERRLIVSPGRCWLPDGWRAWGWTVQLYGARSRQSWGIGDLADLRAIRKWAESTGAGFLMVNPLCAVAPTFPQEDSPYLPASRRFHNPLYLRVEEIPGADDVDLADLSTRGRALNGDALIDRDAAWRLKEAALRRLFAVRGAVGKAGEFETWRAEQGRSLQDFATWCSLAEVHGDDWRDWASGLQHPDSAAVAEFAAEHAERVTFHAWLQWLLDGQLRSASGELPVIQDLPIGVHGGGADAWAWQDTLAGGAAAGAPPDIFNTAGQSWAAPPLIPWRLRMADYQPFIESIRAIMAGSGGVRIDHIMGLFRLWWVPEDHSPADGAYVRYPSSDLLDIVALESHRARAIVVGEDLGTVEPGVRETLAEHRILSYRLLCFEEADPQDWPRGALAAVTTHDLPTIAGLWTGSDLADQARWTSTSTAELERGRDELLARLVQMPPDASAAAVVVEAHRRLSRAPCVLVSATLEDAVVQERRSNLPGVRERPNWRIPLAVPVEDLPSHPTAAAIAALLGNAVSNDAVSNDAVSNDAVSNDAVSSDAVANGPVVSSA
jgi:4-alpha-glucanotransferase